MLEASENLKSAAKHAGGRWLAAAAPELEKRVDAYMLQRATGWQVLPSAAVSMVWLKRNKLLDIWQPNKSAGCRSRNARESIAKCWWLLP